MRIETNVLNEISANNILIKDIRVQGFKCSNNRFIAMVVADDKLDIKLDIKPMENPKVFMAVIDKEGYKFKSNILQWESISDNI